MPKAPESRGAQLETYSVFDFRKGLDIKTSPLQIAVQKGQNSLRWSKNTVYTASGSVSSRFDYTQITNAGFGSTVAVTGGFEYTKSDGTKICIVGTDDGRISTLDVSSGANTNGVTGLTSGTNWFFTEYNHLLIATNRADAPRKYDGTSFGTLGGSPPSDGGPAAVHGNRVFMWDGTNKSTLYWCALDNEEDWTTANNAGSTPIAENDGSNGMNLIPAVGELVLVKGNRAYRLQGTSPATFTIADVVPATGSKGSISHMGAVFAINDTWFLADNGLVNLRSTSNFGDLKSSFATDKIQPYFEPENDNTLSIQNLSGAVVCYDPQWNRIYVAVDSDDDGDNDIVLVLDLHTNAWSVWEDLAVASMWTFRNATTGFIEVFAGTYNGHVIALNRNVSTNTYLSEARHLSALGSPGVIKSPRYVYMYMKEEGNFTVNLRLSFDFGSSGGTVYPVSLAGGSNLLGVNWTLGEDPLGAAEQIVKRIDVSGVGEFVELAVYNETAGVNWTWYGYEILWRARRTVRGQS